MSILYRLLLTISSTSFILSTYAIANSVTTFGDSLMLSNIAMIALPIVLSYSTIIIAKSKQFGSDELNNCKEFSLKDFGLLLNYFLYFFIAILVPNFELLVLSYIAIFIAEFFGRSMYANPVYLLFGYHFYEVKTSLGKRITIIAKGKVDSPSDLNSTNLKRMNNNTFLKVK